MDKKEITFPVPARGESSKEEEAPKERSQEELFKVLAKARGGTRKERRAFISNMRRAAKKDRKA